MPSRKKAKATKKKAARKDPPEEVEAIRKAYRHFLTTVDPSTGRPIGKCSIGVYAYYDYDGEPIYVGQTYEGLGSRSGRHITNQRTDAVAMSVLDVFEVADVEVWPFWQWESLTESQKRVHLRQAEYTVYAKLVALSRFNAVLNETPPRATALIPLPASFRARIIPEDIYERRKHADVRIARRASTIARLAQRISERKVKDGLRATLLVQAQRLEHLASERLAGNI